MILLANEIGNYILSAVQIGTEKGIEDVFIILGILKVSSANVTYRPVCIK